MLMAMVQKGITRGSVPCMYAEDETSIQPGYSWDPTDDTMPGSCGKLCVKRCTHIKNCRAAGCVDPHACAHSNQVHLVVGDDADSYQRMLDFAESHRAGTPAGGDHQPATRGAAAITLLAGIHVPNVRHHKVRTTPMEAIGSVVQQTPLRRHRINAWTLVRR